MNAVAESTLYGISMALAMFFWVWFFRRLYLNGWRPLFFVLIAIGWQHLMFAIAWLRFSRRRDKLDAFLDEANRTKPKPISGLIGDAGDK